MNDNRIYADVPAPASPGAPQNTQPPVYPVSAPAEPYRFTPPKPREAVPAVPLDGGIALACYAAGWCFLRLVWPGYLGLGMLLFTAAFAGMALFYRHGAGQPVPRGSYGWLLMMLLSAGSFVVLDNGLLSWLNLLFLMVAAVYWVAALFGTRMEGQLGERLGVDLANHLFVVPFQNFGCFAAVLRSTLSRTRLGKNVGIGLLSLLCSFTLLWFVCRELSAVTAGFGVALEQLGQLVSIRSIFSATTLLAVPTACYLFGLLYGCRRRRYTGTFTQEGLEAAARRQEDFTGSFVHELKTPLTSIIGYADMLRSRSLDEDRRFKAASYIFSEGKRLENLSLALMSLLLVGHSAADARPVNMRRLCQEAGRICQPAMHAKGLTLSVRAEEGLLRGDAALLQTLLQNLLDNARKAADSGQVVLSGKSTEGGYRVTVADQGRGIPEGELNKITEPFYMVDKSRSRAEGGAGLGLALCKKIAALHGGELRFESREGRGTTVTVELGGVADAQ